MDNPININLTFNMHGNSKPLSLVSGNVIDGEGGCLENAIPNPMDYLGKMHNEFLDKVLDSDMSLEELIATAEEWFGKKLGIDIPEINKMVEKGLESNLYDLFEQSSLTCECSKKYLHLLADTMFKPETYVISKVIDNVKFLESRVISDTMISRENQKVVMTTLAIARNSLEYWDSYFEEIFKSTARKKRPFWKKFWKVVGVTAADVGAGFLGNLVAPGVGTAAAGAASKAAL